MPAYESTPEVQTPAGKRTDLPTLAPQGILVLPSLLKWWQAGWELPLDYLFNVTASPPHPFPTFYSPPFQTQQGLEYLKKKILVKESELGEQEF